MLQITVGFMDHPSQELDQERHYYSTEQWFSNLSVQQNHAEHFLKHRLLGPIPEFLIPRSEVGLGICIANKFSCDADVAGLGTPL